VFILGSVKFSPRVVSKLLHACFGSDRGRVYTTVGWFYFHRGRFQTWTIPVSELVGVEFTLEWDGLCFQQNWYMDVWYRTVLEMVRQS
jgi:hypothetical protein